MSQNPGPAYGQTPPPDQPYGYPPQQPATQPYGQPQQPATQPYGQPQQPATQPYGQQPAAQPYGQQPAAQPYGQPQQPTAQPYAYPSQQAPTQPYGQPVQGFAPTPMGAYGSTAAPVKRSSILGIIGLALVVICGVILSVYLYKIGAVAGPYAQNGTLDTTTQPQLVQDVMNQMGTILPLLGSLSVAGGLIGWIIGIVATATKRGRGFGVTAIILGVLAPILAFVAMFVGIGTTMAH